VSDRYSDSISDIRNCAGVGEAVSDGGAISDDVSDVDIDSNCAGVGEAVSDGGAISDDVSDVDIDSMNCGLGRAGSLLMATGVEDVGGSAADVIADTGDDNDIACLC
jgi:hypothetical protein